MSRARENLRGVGASEGNGALGFAEWSRGGPGDALIRPGPAGDGGWPPRDRAPWDGRHDPLHVSCSERRETSGACGLGLPFCYMGLNTQ